MQYIGVFKRYSILAVPLAGGRVLHELRAGQHVNMAAPKLCKCLKRSTRNECLRT